MYGALGLSESSISPSEEAVESLQTRKCNSSFEYITLLSQESSQRGRSSGTKPLGKRSHASYEEFMFEMELEHTFGWSPS